MDIYILNIYVSCTICPCTRSIIRTTHATANLNRPESGKA